MCVYVLERYRNGDEDALRCWKVSEDGRESLNNLTVREKEMGVCVPTTDRERDRERRSEISLRLFFHLFLFRAF